MKAGRMFQMVATALLLSGCVSGVRFAPDSLNGQAWPAELSARQYFKSAGVYYRNLSGLVGHVLYTKRVSGDCPEVYTDANLSLEQYLLPGTKLEPDTTAVERFSDKIDSNASVDASVLTFASKLKVDQAAEVVVTDTTTLVIPDESVDLKGLYQLADQAPRDDECERYFIRGAIVTTITYRTATVVDGSATVSGSAFGASGKVYNATHKYSLDFRLGLTVLPVRRGMKVSGQAAVSRAIAPKPLENIVVPAEGFQAR